jgi:hypothetical protein
LLTEDHRMLKRLLIPVLAFTVAAIGCGGNSNRTIGGDGETGAAGTEGATAGASGATAGVSGATAGTSGGEAGTSGGTDAGSDGAFPACNLETFCPVFLATCGTTTKGYTTLAECMTTFAAVGAASPYQQQCESYHLCLALAYDPGSDRTLHCSHAAGGGNVCGFSTTN